MRTKLDSAKIKTIIVSKICIYILNYWQKIMSCLCSEEKFFKPLNKEIHKITKSFLILGPVQWNITEDPAYKFTNKQCEYNLKWMFLGFITVVCNDN